MHAMVLDTVEQITKNSQRPGYEIGDYKLIFKNTYDNEYNGQPKKYTMNANNENAPGTFYYVHIVVDLDQIKDIQKAKKQGIQQVSRKQKDKKCVVS